MYILFSTECLEYEFEIKAKELPEVNDEFIKEAIETADNTEVIVKGIVAASTVNQDGFYLIDDTGVIAVVGNKEDVALLSAGDEVVVKGIKSHKVKEGYTGAGQINIYNAEILVNYYGNHEYSTSTFDSTKTINDLYNYNYMEDHSNEVYVVKAIVKVISTPYSTNIKLASLKGVELLVFPELSITSSTCGDLFYQDTLLDSAIDGLKRIVNLSIGIEMVILVGLPIKFESLLYDACAVICKGEILGFVPKTYTPSYNEFYHSRQFKGAFSGIKELEIDGKTYPFSSNLIFKSKTKTNFTFSVEIGSDLFLNLSPSQINSSKGGIITANLSSFNAVAGRDEEILTVIKGISRKCLSGYVLSNCGQDESTTDWSVP